MLTALKNYREDALESFREKAQKNANLMTGFLVLIIVISGLGVAEHHKAWWIAGLCLLGVFILLFLVANAMALARMVFSVLALLITLNFTFELATNSSSSNSLGLVWVTAQVFLYFFIISLSFLMVGTRSRWSSAGYTMIVFTIISALTLDAMPGRVAVLIALVVSMVFFMAIHRWIKMFLGLSKMPTHALSPTSLEALKKIADSSEWKYRERHSKKILRDSEATSFIFWKERAYVFYSVNLSQKLMVEHNRRGKGKLTYNGKSINTWLLFLNSKLLPLWATKNSPMMLVLLDDRSSNGKKAETIGVGVADSAHPIPVGIYPFGGGPRPNFLADLDREYGKFLQPLNEKQKASLGELGSDLKSEAHYLETTSVTEPAL